MVVDATGATLLLIPAGTPTHPIPPPDLANFSVADLAARAGQPFSRHATQGSSVTYRVLVSKFGDNGDMLVLAAPITDQQETLRQLATIQLVAAVAALIVIGTLVWLFSRVAIKPIEDMIGVATAIGEGDLGARIDADSHGTEVARLASALNAMLNQLEVAFAAKDASEARLRRFAADASHELRTPLTTIQGWADLYASGGANSAEMISKAMDRISGETQRMAALVEDLSSSPASISSVPSTANPSTSEPSSLTPSRTSEPSNPNARSRSTCHPGRSSSAATRPGYDRSSPICSPISACTPIPSCLPTSPWASTMPTPTLVIADDGHGLTEQDAAHAFDRFYRSEDSRARTAGGTGLGLAIVQSVIEAHGGEITLASAPGEGAVFTIRLPRDAERSIEMAAD